LKLTIESIPGKISVYQNVLRWETADYLRHNVCHET
jgi:hypothetical protein